jgi:hypothetical protein
MNKKELLRNYRMKDNAIIEEYHYSATGVLFHDLNELNHFTDEDDIKTI